MPPRRFPPPWFAEVTPNCFILPDANAQQLAYVYYENEPGRRSAAKLLKVPAANRQHDVRDCYKKRGMCVDIRNGG
jgi:hypothetical protein